MSSFSITRTSFQKHREDEEANKKREEDETARLYQEFVESFQGDNAPESKTFVRGGVVNPNEKMAGEKSKDRVSVPKKESRFEIAWRDAKYAQIYDYLREKYEVTQRFGSLDYKLKFVEHNIHFLQEVIQNGLSDLLERCIIFLLSVENIISICEIVQG